MTRNDHESDGIISRLPPHSPEAEQGVLGCIMLDPNESMPLCIEKIRDGAGAFYDLRHQTIYEVMVEMYEDREPIDMITMIQRLGLWGKLEQVGGATYLSGLADVVPSALNLPTYLDILRGKNTMRKMIHVCTEVVGRIYDAQTDDVDQLMDEVERDVLQISESRIDPVSNDIHTLVAQSIQDFEAAMHNPGVAQGITTGYVDYDKLTDGLHGGEMIVIAARPAMGKTSLAMNIAEHVACQLHLPVGIVSLEMTAKELVKRMICSRARVNFRSVRDGEIAPAHCHRITVASGAIASAPIYIDDTGGQSIMQVRARARRWWQHHQIKLLVIDYLQLMNAADSRRKFTSRQEEVSQISTGVKNLAKELGIPVIVLSQLNRELERDKNRKPRLSDLRESGSIEQDADFVGLLYNPQGDEENESSDYIAQSVNLFIGKQRNGPANVDVNFTFLKAYTRFESAAKVTEDDVPPNNNSHSSPPEPEPEPAQPELYGN